MTSGLYHIESRSVLSIEGSERLDFLERLLTNQISDLEPGRGRYAALLTPQGKFLFDFLVTVDGDRVWLDVEKDRKDVLIQKLTLYKLRADVQINDHGDSHSVYTWLGDGPCPYSVDIQFPDPRHTDLGLRLIAPTLENANFSPIENYHQVRINAGVPEGSPDIKIDKYFWLEARAEALNGVSFSKGCYVGQEQTSRMKHRATLKKSLVSVVFDGETAPPGTSLENDQHKTVGELHSTSGNLGLAYLRLAASEEPLYADGHPLKVIK